MLTHQCMSNLLHKCQQAVVYTNVFWLQWGCFILGLLATLGQSCHRHNKQTGKKKMNCQLYTLIYPYIFIQIYAYISYDLSLYIHTYLSIYISIPLFIYMYLYLSIYPSIHLYIIISIYMYQYPSIHLPLSHYPGFYCLSLSTYMQANKTDKCFRKWN